MAHMICVEGPFDLAGAHSTGSSCITLDILTFWFVPSKDILFWYFFLNSRVSRCHQSFSLSCDTWYGEHDRFVYWYKKPYHHNLFRNFRNRYFTFAWIRSVQERYSFYQNNKEIFVIFYDSVSLINTYF